MKPEKNTFFFKVKNWKKQDTDKLTNQLNIVTARLRKNHKIESNTIVAFRTGLDCDDFIRDRFTLRISFI
jgi:hypothetical protein